MRSFLICLSLFTVLASLKTQDRSGQVWLDGGTTLNNGGESARGGYFLTDRLLVGGAFSTTSRDFNVTPFVRYYLGQADQKWRPYGEAGLEIGFDQFSLNNYRFAAGLERRFGSNTLLNIELEYTRFEQREFNGYVLNGTLNTILGGPAGASAAQGRFQRGTFTLNNQLFQAGISSGDLFNLSYVDLTPEVGYFLTDRIMGRASLNLGYGNKEQQNFNPEINTTSFDLGLAIGARYYLTTDRLFNLFAESSLNFDSHTTNFNGDSNTTNTLRAKLGLGVSVFLNQNTSIDFGLGLDQGIINDNDLGLDGSIKLNFWFGR